jgi:hypothetical protein
MRRRPVNMKDVALPFSDGTLSARLWESRGRIVVGVPQLGLHCYGSSKEEAGFRLFTSLIKYYKQLKAHRTKLGERGVEHLELLCQWIEGIEQRMMLRETAETRILARSAASARD